MRQGIVTKPKLDDGILSEWPPLAHIIRKDQTVRESMKALCGAKLMGVRLSSSSKTCKKCIEIAKSETSS